MSHRHSFNTRPRVRARQKAALERWEERIKHCAKMLHPDHKPIIQGNNDNWQAAAAIAREQRDILKRKVG